MTRFPREPLDAEERALAARLPRPHGRDEPDPATDARILAAAYAAAAAPAPPATRRRHWLVPAGLAASLCLALGLAWRLQLAPPHATSAGAQAERTPAVDAAGAQPDGAAVPPPEALEAPVSPPAPPLPPRTRAVPEASPVLQETPPAAAVAPPPPAPVPAPMATLPAPPSQEATTAAPRTMAADAAASPSARTAAAQARAVAAKAQAAKPAAYAEDALADAPEVDIPPATADAPEVREAWLRRIGELQREGKTTEARASLAEFRRRYPDAKLPAGLGALEQPQQEPSSD